jgi:hypothetical protein
VQVSTRGAALCATVTAVVALAPGAAGAGSSATYGDRVDDAGRAPDIASVTLTQLDAARLGVTVSLAAPTTLGRSGWVVMGIDTDRNQRTGGMHGSEAIVFVNGERAVLYRLGGRVLPLRAMLDGQELSFVLRFADLGTHVFDFAVATLRMDADIAPDRGVFRYPAVSRHVPALGDLPRSKKR